MKPATVPETAAEPGTDRRAASAPAPVPAPARERECVLLVDDADHSLLVLTAILDADFRVITARATDDIAGLVSSYRPTIIVVDVDVPGVNPRAICGRLSCDAESRRTPLVLLGERIPDARDERWMIDRVTACLQRPFAPIAVLETVRQLVRTVIR